MNKDKNKKRKKAAALKYDASLDDAPIIAALGVGHIADQIIDRAETHDIPVIEDEPMSDVLMQLSVGDAIPPELYEAVAQILIYISQQDGSFKEKLQF